jgi:hypothetical protein
MLGTTRPHPSNSIFRTRTLRNYQPPTPYSQVSRSSQIDRTAVEQKQLYITTTWASKGFGAAALKPSPCSRWENGPAAARILFSFTLFCSYHLNLESDIEPTVCIKLHISATKIGKPETKRPPLCFMWTSDTDCTTAPKHSEFHKTYNFIHTQ